MRFLLVFLISATLCSGQGLTGAELLEESMDYHDPDGLWPTFKGDLEVTMSTKDKEDRISNISIDLPAEYFQLTVEKEGELIQRTISKGDCSHTLNGISDISISDRERHRLSCDRTKMISNYYTYLYGLPMKLKDSGTIIDPLTEERTFKGKKYLVLKATYDIEVGKDTWYFYFDPITYAMEVYQFFKDESQNDGEYILLTGEQLISGIKMPKSRAWYYNKDDKYLGTDVLSK